MIINLKAVKTEALLLFCRDLIESYENNKERIFDTTKELEEFIKEHIENLKKGINAVLQPNDYYIRNIRVSRIKIIMRYYNFINKQISKALENDARFNPAMLCFAMLATWFKELENAKNSKEFIFFDIYPYGYIYDALLVDIKDIEYKKLNIFMVQIAEDIMIKLNNATKVKK